MITLAVSIVGLVGSFLGITALFYKIIRFTTKLEVYVTELRRERKAIRVIPMLSYKVEFIEKHLDLEVPTFHDFNGQDHD